MKKIIGLTIAGVLLLAMVAGGTLAYFQDTETSTANTIAAGTLDLNWDGANDTGAFLFQVSAANGYPGNRGVGSKAIKNVGSFPGELDVALGAITNNDAADTTAEFDSGTGELGGVAMMAIYLDIDVSSSWTSGDIGLKQDSTTYTFVADVTGTADSGTRTTLVDTFAQANDFFNNMLLVITGGTNSGESRLIADFATGGTITVNSPFTAAIDATSVYAIKSLNYDTIDSYGSSTWNAVIAAMGSNDEENFIINWDIPFGTSAVNTFQGDDLSFGLTFKLEQADVD